ncbi:MAG: hypothetical protein JST39_12580, partial [Bacteroidetes bacterium]|nr:hypothetical protein [Bacteroidota bacterium]
MFVFQIMGGLGNQMFQYAAARALSQKRNIPFKVDFDDPYIYAKRRFSLDVFNLPADFASPRELRSCKPKTKFIRRWWKYTGRNPDNKLYREKKDFHFDPAFFNCPDGSYISGFWQSELYFKEIEDVIRKDFSFRHPPSPANKAVLERVEKTNAVSL